jgi:hypothetical protein
MSSVLVQLFVLAAVALADQQSPIAPLRIEPPGGGGNPIVISVTGVEQDPAPVAGRWSAADACLAEIPCFVASWIEANSTASMEHLLALRAPKERTELEKRYREPGLLTRNASRFNEVRKWGLLGWADYGPLRIVFLTRDDSQSQSTIYTLPITRVDGKWMQTDALAADTGVYEMFDRVGKTILARHQKR